MFRLVQSIINIKDKIETKGKKCDGIVLGKLSNVPHAFLIQNAFPATEKYIDHIHTISGVPVQIKSNLKKEIQKNFSKIKSIYFKCHKGIFPDVIRIKQLLIREIPIKERFESAKKQAELLNKNRLHTKNKSREILK